MAVPIAAAASPQREATRSFSPIVTPPGLEFIEKWRAILAGDYEGKVEETLEAATKLAEVASRGYLEAVEQLLLVVDNKSCHSFGRCLAISAVGSAALLSTRRAAHKRATKSKTVAEMENQRSDRMRKYVNMAMHDDDSESEDGLDQPDIKRASHSQASMHPKDDGLQRFASFGGPEKTETPIHCVPLGTGVIVGDSHTVDVLLEAASDEDPTVRLEAVKALALVAQQGDLEVIRALAGNVDDEQLVVGSAAVRALARIGRSHKHRAGGEQLHDEDSEMTSGGDLAIIHLITFTGPDYDAAVRVGAAEGIARVAERGHSDSIEALGRLLLSATLQFNSEDVQDSRSQRKLFGRKPKSSTQGGVQEGAAHHKNILAEVDCSEMRRAAAASLGKLASYGSVHTVNLLLGLLHDPCSEVRAAALVSAITIAGASSDRARKAVLEMMTDIDAEIRVLATMWLGDVVQAPVPEQDPDFSAIWAAIDALADDNADVRRHAAHALRVISPVGDKDVMTALEAQLDNKDWATRSAVAGALESLLDTTADQSILRTFRAYT